MNGETKKPSQGLALAGLILNILVLPGLGTLVAGETKTGTWQIILMVVSVILDFTLIGMIIGIPLGIGVWIWALVSSINIIKQAT